MRVFDAFSLAWVSRWCWMLVCSDWRR